MHSTRPCPQPQPDAMRHPILDGEDEEFRFSKRHGPPSAYDADLQVEPAWRPCVKMIQPISLTAAGVTTQQRNSQAERAALGAQRRPGSAKPRDDEQHERISHRPFTANSHILHPVGMRDPIVKSRETADGPLQEVDCFGRPSNVSSDCSSGGTPAAGATPEGFIRRGASPNANTNAHDIGGGRSTEDAYRPCKGRVPAAQWANHKTASANPNALIADRQEVRSGAFKAPGACRPQPDSLNMELGTAVVGGAWGADAAEAEGWRPSTGRRTPGHPQKSLAPRAMRHNNHTPWGHVELPERGADHGYPTAGDHGEAAAGGVQGAYTVSKRSEAEEEERRRRDEERRANDPRARERAAHEASLRRATRESMDANSHAYEINRARCTGANNILGGFLYEVKGNSGDEWVGPGPSHVDVRPAGGPPKPSIAHPSWHSNYY